MIGCIKYRFGGTVILFQKNNPCIGIILFKAQNITDIRAAPPIDGLIGISYGTQLLRAACELLDEEILGMVCILVLIYMDILKPALIIFQHFRYPLEQMDGLHNQIIEIKRLITDKHFLISHIDLPNLAFKEIPCLFII